MEYNTVREILENLIRYTDLTKISIIAQYEETDNNVFNPVGFTTVGSILDLYSDRKAQFIMSAIVLVNKETGMLAHTDEDCETSESTRPAILIKREG